MILRGTGSSLFFILLAVFFCQAAGGQPSVRPGIDVLLEEFPDLLVNRRVGLITNHTGVSSTLRHSIELLHEHPQINLTALFAPEHGLTGSRAAGARIPSSVEEMTGLKVFSLYGGGDARKPTPAMLDEIDVLLFDIQDIGTRWYTYISTMALAMEAAAENNKRFIVLDRPNPLGGVAMDGPVLEKDYKSFVGMFEIPVVHGMTAGELALLYKSDNGLELDLRVVRMDGWERSMTWPDTGLQWVPTSPHIPSFESALTYPGLGLLGETGLVNVGVGYTLPFQVAGAPYISAEKFAGRLNALELPGVYFRPVYFEPFFGMFRENTCQGVHLHVTKPDEFMAVSTVMHMLEALRDMHPQHFKREFEREFNRRQVRRESFTRHLGTAAAAEALIKGERISPLISRWQQDINAFREKREKFLLY